MISLKNKHGFLLKVAQTSPSEEAIHSLSRAEAVVGEDYLVWRWNHMSTKMGSVPSGTGAIAKMRLAGGPEAGGGESGGGKRSCDEEVTLEKMRV